MMSKSRDERTPSASVVQEIPMSQGDDRKEEPGGIGFRQRTRHAWEDQEPSPLRSAMFWVWIAVAVLGTFSFAYRMIMDPEMFPRP